MELDLRNGDCLSLMKELPDKSVDLVICDLPYGETNCKWDTQIDLELFWKEFKRIRKSKKTACIHFCSTKFGYNLIKSWEKGYKMDLVWKKRNKTGGLQSRYRPMRNHEMIYFFYEQAPQYNRDRYHKRINTKTHNLDTNVDGSDCSMGKSAKMSTDGYIKCFDPPNPGSVVQEESKKTFIDENTYKDGERTFSNKAWKGNQNNWDKDIQMGPKWDPKLPLSVVEEGVEMETKEHKDTIYGDTTTTVPKERWGGKSNLFDPQLPASVIEETEKQKRDKEWSTRSKEGKDIFGNNDNREKPSNYDPPNPASVVEEKAPKKGWSLERDGTGNKQMGSAGPNWDPKLPGSVVEGPQQVDGEPQFDSEGKGVWGYDKEYSAFHGSGEMTAHFEPPNPLSVIEEDKPTNAEKLARTEGHTEISMYKNEYADFANYDPPNPASVVESTKCFVGKRNHQTEKPIDVLEFLIKYWSDEDWTILDPTMGSGSTGVAARKLKRKFIGFELDDKIFKKAQERCKKEPEQVKKKPVKKKKTKTKVV